MENVTKSFNEIDPFEIIGDVWVPIDVNNDTCDLDKSVTVIVDAIKNCNTLQQCNDVLLLINAFEQIHKCIELSNALTTYLNLKYDEIELYN